MPKPLARRQILGAGVAGAALFALPEACSSGGSGGGDAGADVKSMMEAGASDACPAADYVRSINISSVGIAKPGTSYEFTDDCYMDPACGQGRILVIHPVTKDVYVALSGTCPHMCCDSVPPGSGGPTYYATLDLPDDGGTVMPFLKDAGGEKDSGSSKDAGDKKDAGEKDGGGGKEGGPEKDGAVADTGADTGPVDAGGDSGTLYSDVIFCTCHGSLFNALNGDRIAGPAPTGLQMLTSMQDGSGNLNITIPMPKT